MKHIHKVIVVAGVAAMLGGCSSLTGKQGYFRDKGGDYADARLAPGLKIPASLPAATPREDYLDIPPVTSSAEVLPDDVPRAARRVVRTDGAAFQIIELGSRRVLLTDTPAAELWQHLLKFWASQKITVHEQDARTGVMVTDWVRIDDVSNPGLMRRMVGKLINIDNATDSREKFRLTLRAGSRNGSSEVELQHARVALGAKAGEVNWAEQRGDSLVHSMLDEMLVFLVQAREQQSVAQLSKALDIGEQTSLVRDGNGNPVLRIEQSFARSWQAVEMALQNIGLNATDKNRSAGLIFINIPGGDVAKAVTEKEEKKGWLSGLFGSSKKDEPDQEGKDEFRLRLQSVGDTTNVTLEKDVNTLPSASVSGELLRRLRDNLE